MTFVTIVLPLYNAEKYLDESLECLKNQSLNDYELIIIDDCSTDKTSEILDKYGISYYKNETNLGYPKNLNNCIKIAKGEYIIVADQDMIYEKNYIKNMLSVKQDIVISRCYYYKIKNKIRNFGENINLLTGKTKVYGRDEFDCGQFDYIKEVELGTTPMIMIKRDVFEKIGFFDESFKKYYTDVDFCFRARKAGYKIFLSGAKCWHKKEEKEFFNKKQFEDYYNDKKLFLKKNSPYYPLPLIPIKIKKFISK